MDSLVYRFPNIIRRLNESEVAEGIPSSGQTAHSSYEGSDGVWFAKIDMAEKEDSYTYTYTRNAINDALDTGGKMKILLHDCNAGDFSMLRRKCKEWFGDAAVISLDFDSVRDSEDYDMLLDKAKNASEKCVILVRDSAVSRGLDLSLGEDCIRYRELAAAALEDMMPGPGVAVMVEEKCVAPCF